MSELHAHLFRGIQQRSTYNTLSKAHCAELDAPVASKLFTRDLLPFGRPRARFPVGWPATSPPGRFASGPFNRRSLRYLENVSTR